MKTYFMRFGSGDPRQFAGLQPTFLMFKLSDDTDVTPPAISEVGSSSGIFYFQWGTTTPITFLADAATTSPGAIGRYVSGAIDPADRADEYATTLTAIGASTIAFGQTLTAIGTTNIALGTTAVALGTSAVALGQTNVALGTTAVALGSTSVALGETAVAIGTTALAYGVSNLAVGTTILDGISLILTQGITVTAVVTGIGTPASSFGDSTTDPVDL